MGFAFGAVMLLIFIGECLPDLSEGDMVLDRFSHFAELLFSCGGKNTMACCWRQPDQFLAPLLSGPSLPGVLILMPVSLLITSYDSAPLWGMWGFPTLSSSSQTPAGCPTIQFCSHTVYLETVWGPEGKGAVLQDWCPSHWRCYFKVQAVPRASDWLAVDQRFPRPPPQLQLICWHSSKNSDVYIVTGAELTSYLGVYPG